MTPSLDLELKTGSQASGAAKTKVEPRTRGRWGGVEGRARGRREGKPSAFLCVRTGV